MKSQSSNSAEAETASMETKPPWLNSLRHAIEVGECIELTNPVPWGNAVALALAPHPDDPEAIAVTLRLLATRGWQLHYAIVTSGWSGVLDDFVGPDRKAKAQARGTEQEAAAQLFGLPEDQLIFMNLDEEETGSLAATPLNRKRLRALLDGLSPELVLLPWQFDSNPTHRLVYQWFAEWAAGCAHGILGLGNQDPKTLEFQAHLQVTFDEAKARWKERLLECHKSQSARNLVQRGHNFAARILTMNRAAPGIPKGQYAERFQAAYWEID